VIAAVGLSIKQNVCQIFISRKSGDSVKSVPSKLLQSDNNFARTASGGPEKYSENLKACFKENNE